MNQDYYAGMTRGRTEERERITKQLSDYFALTQEPDDRGNVTDNPEWDNGFQAALALIKGEQK